MVPSRQHATPNAQREDADGVALTDRVSLTDNPEARSALTGVRHRVAAEVIALVGNVAARSRASSMRQEHNHKADESSDDLHRPLATVMRSRADKATTSHRVQMVAA